MSTRTPFSLGELLGGIESHRYAVMKTLPDAQPIIGSDIDLLCDDQVALGRTLIQRCRLLIDQGYTVRVRQKPERNQTHIDVMQGDQIQLRFDLHQGLDAYPGLAIRETYAAALLDRRQWAELTTPAATLRLAVPDDADNLVLRYLEYHAYFAARPDKIKHAEVVAEAITREAALKDMFFDRLSQAMTTRPAAPVLQHTGLNLRRQITWLYWSLRDKVAWRLRWAKEVLTLALTEPGVFTRKLINKLAPRHA